MLTTATVGVIPVIDQSQVQRQARPVKTFFRSFYEHPRGVGQTYLQHFLFASGFSLRLLGASGAGMVHAFVPALFESTTSRTVTSLHAKMHRQVNAESSPKSS